MCDGSSGCHNCTAGASGETWYDPDCNQTWTCKTGTGGSCPANCTTSKHGGCSTDCDGSCTAGCTSSCYTGCNSYCQVHCQTNDVVTPPNSCGL